jgi:hypothetical protein
MDCEMNVNATSTDGGRTVISIFAKKEKKKEEAMRGEWTRMNHDGDNVPGVFQEVKFLSGGSGDGGKCNAGKRKLQYPASSRRSTNSLDEPQPIIGCLPCPLVSM